MEHRALADQCDHRRPGIDQRPQIGIVFATGTRSTGHPERGDFRLPQAGARDAPKKLRVLGVRARPAALEVVDPQVIQAVGDLHLVFDRERHPFALRPVPQRRVVQKELHSSPCRPKTATQKRAASHAARGRQIVTGSETLLPERQHAGSLERRIAIMRISERTWRLGMVFSPY